MSDRNVHDPEGDEHRRVREVLKGLPKKKAPWHFESALNQRLHEEKRPGKSRRWFTAPAPAYALSGLTAAVLVVVGYYTMYLPSSRDDQHSDAPGEILQSGEQPKQTVSGEQPSSPSPQVRPTEGITVPERTTKGPSSSPTETVIESPVMKRDARNGLELKVQDTPQEGLHDFPLSATQSRTVETPVGAIGLRLDSLVGPALRDSLDSLQAGKDSATLLKKGDDK